jgi:DNA adenine methylase
MKPERPILRYHGGKWELAKWIIAHLPPHHVYCEPFGGAASVLLQKERSYAEIYNDLDGEIVNLFRVIREHPVEFEKAVRATPFSRTEYFEAFNATEQPIEWARRVLIRSHMGHAGAATHGHMSGFRSRSLNSGSHPAAQWCNLPDHLTDIIERFRGVVIEHEPALEVIARHDDARTVFYIDPPYVMSSRDKGSDYRHEMDDAAHEQLAERLQSVAGMVVLSGYHTALYDRLYSTWTAEQIEATAESGAKRVEVLWMNGAAVEALAVAKGPTLFDEEAA